MTSDLEREIAETREHLGETVDALTAKLDVKGRAQTSIAEADKRPLLAGVVMAGGAAAAWLLWPHR